MTFAGSTNKPIEEVFRDTTGNRRFYQLDALARLDWDAINRVDYITLWSAASELEPSPLIPHRAAVLARQAEHTHRDAVAQWLGDELWGPVSIRDPHGNQRVAAGLLDDFIPADDAYARLAHFCAGAGERAPSQEQMGVRLRAQGWERKQRRVDGRQRWGYVAPVSLQSAGDAGDTGDTTRTSEKHNEMPVTSTVTSAKKQLVTPLVTPNATNSKGLEAVTSVTSGRVDSSYTEYDEITVPA